MAGIYIHIPFCVEKCSYCSFFSITDFSLQDLFVKSLYKEMDFRADYLNRQSADSLYFGGGTPSVLPPEMLEKIIRRIDAVFGLNSNAEITLEANPNNLDEDYFKQLSQTPINRLSIGIQSFFDEHLTILGRIHTGKQAKHCLNLAQKYNFSNLSVDLMYGYPLLTEKQWIENLQTIQEINHLSCYSLNLEPDSVLYKEIKKGKYHLPNEEEVLEQYRLLTAFAKESNFIHYEISNFCKPNQFSRHNSAYWKNEKYIGLGTGAHSFNGDERQWNIANLKNYIDTFSFINTPCDWEKLGNKLYEKEFLTPTMKFNEYLMISLRTCWGCDLDAVKDNFGDDFLSMLLQKIDQLDQNFYFIENNHFILSEKGFLLADAIASELFFEE